MWRKEPIEIGEWVHPGRAERCRSESGGVGATPGLSTWNWSLLVTFRQMTHVFFHSSYTSLPNIPTQPQLNGTPKSSRKPCPLTSLIWQYVFSKVRLKGCLVSHIQLIKNSKTMYHSNIKQHEKQVWANVPLYDLHNIFINLKLI